MVKKCRVTIRKKKHKGKTYLYEINKCGKPVEVAKTRGEAQMKANRIRDSQGKYKYLNRMSKRRY